MASRGSQGTCVWPSEHNHGISTELGKRTGIQLSTCIKHTFIVVFIQSVWVCSKKYSYTNYTTVGTFNEDCYFELSKQLLLCTFVILHQCISFPFLMNSVFMSTFTASSVNFVLVISLQNKKTTTNKTRNVRHFEWAKPLQWHNYVKIKVFQVMKLNAILKNNKEILCWQRTAYCQEVCMVILCVFVCTWEEGSWKYGWIIELYNFTFWNGNPCQMPIAFDMEMNGTYCFKAPVTLCFTTRGKKGNC